MNPTLRVLVALLSGLVPGSAAAATQVYPVSATAGFETGIVTLASLDGLLPKPSKNRVKIDWGDGVITPALLANCTLWPRGARDCDVLGTHPYASAGSYPIAIDVNWGAAGHVWYATQAVVSPPGDFVILSIGDSVASGEGNPVVQKSHANTPKRPNAPDVDGFWDDVHSNGFFDKGVSPAAVQQYYNSLSRCHRSLLAGPALAAQTIERAGTSVTFVHQACSGARLTVGGGVLSLREQLRNSRWLLPRIDVLLISGGANDIGGGFGQVILKCVVGACALKQSMPKFKARIAADFANLPALYDELADEIAIPPVPKLTLITEYYDPTHRANGAPCPLIDGITKPEWRFLYDQMVRPLNDHVAAAAQAHGWGLVDGIEAAFGPHGYCVKGAARWVRGGVESIIVQGERSGTAHPRDPGQQFYAARIADEIFRRNPPSTLAGATAGGAHYEFGSVADQPVTVKLEAANPISQSGLGRSFFAVDDPSCGSDPSHCLVYQRSFTIAAPGLHWITFFSENGQGFLEPPNTLPVLLSERACAPGQGSCLPASAP